MGSGFGWTARRSITKDFGGPTGAIFHVEVPYPASRNRGLSSRVRSAFSKLQAQRSWWETGSRCQRQTSAPASLRMRWVVGRAERDVGEYARPRGAKATTVLGSLFMAHLRSSVLPKAGWMSGSGGATPLRRLSHGNPARGRLRCRWATNHWTTP